MNWRTKMLYHFSNLGLYGIAYNPQLANTLLLRAFSPKRRSAITYEFSFKTCIFTPVRAVEFSDIFSKKSYWVYRLNDDWGDAKHLIRGIKPFLGGRDENKLHFTYFSQQFNYVLFGSPRYAEIWDWQRDIWYTLDTEHLPNSPIVKMAMNEYKGILVTASFDGLIDVWHVDKKKIIHDMRLPIHFAIDYQYFQLVDQYIVGQGTIAGVNEGKFLSYVWNWKTKRVEYHFPSSSLCSKIDRTGTWAAYTSDYPDSCHLVLVHLPTGQETRLCRYHENLNELLDTTTHILFIDEIDKIVTLSLAGALSIINRKTGTYERIYNDKIGEPFEFPEPNS
jgi:hypothetical protein